MSVEQKLTDKNVVTTATSLTKTNKKIKNNSNNNSSSSSNSNSSSSNKNNNKNNKKLIKKALKISKIQNQVISNNVNNKNTNNKKQKKNNANSSSGSASGSGSVSIISSKNNIEDGNDDEIIEELFDFSDTDIKELDDISDNNSISRTEILDEIPKNIKNGAAEVAKEDRKSQLSNVTSDDNNNHKNEEESKREEKQEEQVELLLSAQFDNTDKPNDYNDFSDSVLVTTAGKQHIMSEKECVDKTTSNINQQKEEDIKSEKKDDETETNNDLLPNKDSSLITATQIPYSSIVSDNSMSCCEADNSDMKLLSTSSDMKSIKANKSSESLLIEFKETKYLNENNNIITANNNNNNNDDGGYDDDDEDEDDNSAKPYNRLLVQFLDEANQIAEARLAARRQARAEAREIRMRELERQQKEQESNADRVFDMHSTVTGITPLSHMRLGLGSSPVTGLLNSTRGNSMSSRRSSEDSLEEEGRSLRDIRHELKEVEERFRKAMIANAQLDNDRASQTYQIQLLKDKLEDMEESYSQLQRECKEKTRDCNALKRSLDKLSEELKLVQGQLNERDTLIAEQGLIIVAIENEDGTDAKRALVSVENAQLLGSVQGSLDVRLKKFSEEKQQLQSEVQQLQEQLESYKSQGKGRAKGNSSNGPLGSDDDDYEAQREANKIISDYKYKLQKAEQEIASLQSSLARSETQVIRYKSTAEAAEKAEAELKIERRKLQRENREAMEKLEELETSNNHLLKRLDKLKNAKSALLKDL